MTIQDDIQVVRRGDTWELVGAVNLGEMCSSLDVILKKKKQQRLATHVLQYMFVGFNGFRWPVAYFSTSTAKAYEIFLTFWEVVNALTDYDFTVDFSLMDGASTNRSFVKLHFNMGPELFDYAAPNVFNPAQKVIFLQDVKHIVKKVRNGAESSRLTNTNAGRCLTLNGKQVVWEHWQEAFQ
jgi:hypothetical protein